MLSILKSKLTIYLVIGGIALLLITAFTFCNSCKNDKELELVEAYSKTITALYAKQTKLQKQLTTIETEAMERILTNEENVDSFITNVNSGAFRVRTTSSKISLSKDDTTTVTCAADDTYLSSRAVETIERLRAKENRAIEALNLCYKSYNLNYKHINGE